MDCATKRRRKQVSSRSELTDSQCVAKGMVENDTCHAQAHSNKATYPNRNMADGSKTVAFVICVNGTPDIPVSWIQAWARRPYRSGSELDFISLVWRFDPQFEVDPLPILPLWLWAQPSGSFCPPSIFLSI